jgi:hypothetical protein
MDAITKRKLIISGSLFVVLNILMMFSRSTYSLIPTLLPTLFSYFMMSILPTSAMIEGKEHSLSKLNQRTLLITAAAFSGIFIVSSFSSIFGAIISASIAALVTFIAQLFLFYKAYMKPAKPSSSMQMEKHDPLHDWNNPYSVYRSAIDHDKNKNSN